MADSPASSPAVAEPQLLRMAAPVVLSFWMRAAFSLVDTAYAATLPDPDAAIAAIGLAVPLEFMLISCWVGASTGLTSRLSRAMGARRGEEIGQLLGLARGIVLVLTAVFAAVGVGVWFVAPRIGLEPVLARQFQIYGTVIMLGSALTAFWSVIPDSLVKAHHDTKATMWAGIWSNIINVVLNTVFVFAFGWGIFGIALSTVISRIGGLVYALNKAAAHERRRIDSGRDVVPGTDPGALGAMARLAVPAAVAYTLMALEGGAINGLLSRQPDATAALAAYSVFHRAFLFLVMPVIAVTIAMLPYVARYHGLGRMDRIRGGFREAMLASLAYVVVFVGPLAYGLGPWVAGLLAEDPGTVDRILFALRVTPLMCLASIPFILCRPMFEGFGTGLPVAIGAALRYLVLTVPLCLGGLWLAPRYGYPPFYGLLSGLTVATAIVSVTMWVWLIAVLPAEAPAPAPEAAPVD